MSIISLPTRNYCSEHKVYFSKDKKCPLCSFTSNSQAITSNSQRVLIPKRKYVRKVKDSIYERFHNFGVKFDAEILWEHLFKYDEVRLNNNVSYKRLDFDSAIVKVFRRSILVTLRSSAEILNMPVKQAEIESIKKVNEVLDMLPQAVKIKNRKIVNVHNAFVNHPTAKHNVNVSVDNEVRLISDNSKGFPEFEAVNPSYAISDSEILENFNRDLIVNNPEPLSVQSQKVGFIVDVLNDYATNMKKHIEVMDNINKGINTLNSQIRIVGREGNSPINNSDALPTISKYDSQNEMDDKIKLSKEMKVKKIKEAWGW
jgi:hypothetical protein